MGGVYAKQEQENSNLTYRLYDYDRVGKDGKKREEKGKYTYDEKLGEICLYGGVGKTFKRKFPLKNGKMDVTVRLGDKTLSMRFVQK